MTRLDGAVAIITGGARGMGAATARLLAGEGAAVIVADVLDAAGQALADEIGSRAQYLHLDVSDEGDWRRAAAAVEQRFGPVSILVNNAGILDFGTIEDQSLAAFRRVIDVNLQGCWLGMHTMAPQLRRTGGGVIVNISSTAGLTGYAGLGAYVASKWGIRGLTRTAALELGQAGIRVCSIHPGAVRTPMTAGMDESTTAGQPIARYGEPEEVARLVLFLVTDATYSTGSEFVLDGGATAGFGPALPAADAMEELDLVTCPRD
ncbi:MAG: 3-alpha-hydroxysteroid dehydrogenase [Actinobacteria bacterium 69-20]|jgi:3alpha(or 20beta)-hydroxysteroid dehydrogenase|nr:SDR family oxidoreductase [Actinomycetota bacterium]OJV28745.1 MAG: 3-alpha-hydroxysteroid dehydrogenase [Actinobacteria bacterium 69-20]